jgi:MFS family permease
MKWTVETDVVRTRNRYKANIMLRPCNSNGGIHDRVVAKPWCFSEGFKDVLATYEHLKSSGRWWASPFISCMEPADERDRPAAAGAPAEIIHQEGIPVTRPDPIAALRHSGYLLYLIGSVLTNTGNQMRTVAVGWEVYSRTRQPLSLGIIGLVLALPVLLLALPAGAAADRYPRKNLIMAAQGGLALCGFGLAWSSYVQAPLPIVYLLLFGTGIFRAVGWPASQAIVTGLVPAPLFANATMWRSVAFQISATLGPLLGGVLLAVWSPAPVYMLDALSSLILMGCLFFVHPAPQARSTQTRSWKSLLEGARFVRRQPIILSTITLDMVAVLFGGATALLPVYATDVLNVGATGFGWLRAMPSLGAITMGLMLAVRPPMRHAGRMLLVAVTAFGVSTIIFGLSRSFPLSIAALFVLGAADNVSVVIRSTVLQLLTPDAMRGRVAAVNTVFIGTSNEIGELESGVAAQWLGTVPAVAGGGVMTLLTVAAVSWTWPMLLGLGRLEDLEPEEPALSDSSGSVPKE